MIKIAICDDEDTGINNITQLIGEFWQHEDAPEIIPFNNGDSLLSFYDVPGKADILFMDIEIGDSNGIEIVNKIREIDKNVIVIFVTSYEVYVAKAFRVGAFQYLQKPIDRQEFKEDFYRALKACRLLHTKYKFQSGGNIVILEYNQIYYLEINNKKITVYTKSSSFVLDGRENISKKEKELQPYGFIRCHQGYIVNLQHIRIIGKDNIIKLKNGVSVPVSRKTRKKVLESFNRYFAGNIT